MVSNLDRDFSKIQMEQISLITEFDNDEILNEKESKNGILLNFREPLV